MGDNKNLLNEENFEQWPTNDPVIIGPTYQNAQSEPNGQQFSNVDSVKELQTLQNIEQEKVFVETRPVYEQVPPVRNNEQAMPNNLTNHQIIDEPILPKIEPVKRFSVIENYGEDLTTKEYITNPAIARDSEIKKTMVVILTPEKSALLIGKPGIGKTAIVEGIAYLIQRGEVPNALKGYRVIKINSTSLLGKIIIDGKEELIISLLVEELKQKNNYILFIDEIHTLIGGSADGPMDLANILKPALDRGSVKAIGATTDIEYKTYIIKDRAFLRRFERVDVEEPDEETTVKILLGSLPKIEKKTGIRFKHSDYTVKQLCESIVSATSEFKRVYGLSAMYPDVAFSVLTQAFSLALFENNECVTVLDVYNAIKQSKRIYPDSIIKELAAFREKFRDLAIEEKIQFPIVTAEELDNKGDNYL